MSEYSDYIGVHLHRQPGRADRWVAAIKGNHLGSFKTAREAAKAYNRAAKQIYGEKARLNDIKEAE